MVSVIVVWIVLVIEVMIVRFVVMVLGGSSSIVRVLMMKRFDCRSCMKKGVWVLFSV